MHIKYLAFNIALLISITVSAQDFDIYPRLKDDNVNARIIRKYTF